MTQVALGKLSRDLQLERGRQQSDTRNDEDGDKKDNTREIRKVCIIKPQFRIQITP